MRRWVLVILVTGILMGALVGEGRIRFSRMEERDHYKGICLEGPTQGDLPKVISQTILNITRRVKGERIDVYLEKRGSPLAGQGYWFVVEAERYGIAPALPVAIAGKESTYGERCFETYNAWGLMESRYNGLESWPHGIAGVVDFLHRWFGSPQRAIDCPGYCENRHPWMEDVEANQQEIEKAMQ